MKKVDKEITGKDRIQRELEANGRRRMLQTETADTTERKEIRTKNIKEITSTEIVTSQTAESENGTKTQEDRKAGGGEEESGGETPDRSHPLGMIKSSPADNFSPNPSAGKCTADALTDCRETGKADCLPDCRTQILQKADSRKKDMFPSCQAVRKNAESILADKQEKMRIQMPNTKTDGLQTGTICDMEAILKEGQEEELRALKEWLFKENTRMEMLQKEIYEMQTELEKEKKAFSEYVKAKEQSMEMDQKRLEQESRFFDQKMQILKGGFEQLEEDRRNFQKEQDKFRACKEVYAETQDVFKRYETTEMLFRGVNSFLALKKRYKDLIKMFHPDNVAGDHEMVQLINREYEELKKAYEVGMQA